jgi:phage regulator Rha-like protein
MEMAHTEILKKLNGTTHPDGRVKQVGIIPTLAKGNIPLSEYFIEDSYKDKSGKENRCYQCTKMGCEILANKMTGEKGILFTAKYVERFNKMETVIKENSLESKVMTELSEMREEYVSSCEEIVDAFYEVKGDINLIHQTLNAMAEGFKTMNSTIAALVSIQQQSRVMPKKNRDTSTVTDIAKELRIKPKEVNDILEKEHIIERRNNSIYARPTVQKSWYRNNQYRDGNKVTYYITYTEEGREGVIKIIKKHLPEQMKF